MSAVYGLYADPDSAQIVVDRLRAIGVADPDIVVISSEPFEEHEFGHRDRRSWLFPLAAAGGAVGLLSAWALAVLTEVSWPLPTGGMPIIANWPNLVIIFEVTMLVAVLTTVGSLCVSARLLRRRPKLYDPAVSDGQILVGLESPTLPLDAIERALTTRGGQMRTVA
jgi:hypothetical protein